MNVSLRFGAATDIGRVREINEDSMLQKPPLFVVADGMGGHSAGDVASRMAVESMERLVLGDAEALPAAVKEANREIFERSKQDADLGGMGTTITALIAGESSAQIAHVGDSRAYLLRDGELSRITQDHTVVGRLVQQGRLTEEDAEHHPQRSYLERALGVDADVDVDVSVLETRAGDRILLCSDGLYTMVPESRIADVLVAEDEPEEAANRLCTMAVEAGGSDNVTALVVDYPGIRSRSAKAPSAQPRTRSRRWMFVTAAIVVVVASLGALARAALDRSFYVGVADGEVTIFRGVKGSFAGLDLNEAIARTGLRAGSLPAPEQSRLKEGISASSRAEAIQIVDNLERIATGSPAPQPSASPGSP